PVVDISTHVERLELQRRAEAARELGIFIEEGVRILVTHKDQRKNSAVKERLQAVGDLAGICGLAVQVLDLVGDDAFGSKTAGELPDPILEVIQTGARVVPVLVAHLIENQAEVRRDRGGLVKLDANDL